MKDFVKRVKAGTFHFTCICVAVAVFADADLVGIVIAVVVGVLLGKLHHWRR